ncbi:hypothetical protein [Synechococcus sp. MU1611]|uniref:hypothetical protein n=1 Tax=Synechococcus sp. MU1611 TaxID=2508345 RepID=UPI001CF8C859|nr:hypothetical protein [Synechococcus sp. MU1611]MCB4412045.1 glycosyltransferase family 4 protein [Synechococcus sp. MU1611]
MKISVLCETIQATQSIAYFFDQSLVPDDQKVKFQLHAWAELKHLDTFSRYLTLFDCEYLILSRWYSPDHIHEILREARNNGKKVFLHLDDFLFSVPKSIGIKKWRHYSSAKMLEALYAAAELSDGIIASTNLLANQINEILPSTEIFVLPYWRHFDNRKYSCTDFIKRVYPVIGYMGTQTHADDLELLTPDLDQVLHRNPSIVFETFGIDMPKLLFEKYPNRCSTLDKVESYEEFQSVLSSLGWWVALAPLTQNIFNYCKTNTKFVEYIQAGIPVIASNYGPYQNTPTISDNQIGDQQCSWLEKIETVIFSKASRNLLYERQIRYCSDFSDPNVLVGFYRSIAC